MEEQIRFKRFICSFDIEFHPCSEFSLNDFFSEDRIESIINCLRGQTRIKLTKADKLYYRLLDAYFDPPTEDYETDIIRHCIQILSTEGTIMTESGRHIYTKHHRKAYRMYCHSKKHSTNNQ